MENVQLLDLWLKNINILSFYDLIVFFQPQRSVITNQQNLKTENKCDIPDKSALL